MAIADQVITTIIDAVAALNTRIDDLSAQKAIPGPQGEPGEKGEQGDPGRTPTDGEIKAAAAEWLAANIRQPADGERGPQGERGERGPAPTEEEIALAVSIWFEANADRLRGERGERGPAGPAGSDGVDGRDGNRGPAGVDGARGQDGTGIALIEQRDEASFWITLTDGREFEIELPAGKGIVTRGGGSVYNADLYVNSLTYNNTPAEKIGMGVTQWNPLEKTLNIGMDYDVVQQVGQETYARVGNVTGVTIPNGTVVGFAGANDDALLVAPYIADGSQPSLYILGVMTHDLPDSGQRGYCTTWGFVRDLNTSAFAPGDILYASPFVAGALTNVKPTAPQNVIPIAACVSSHATEGVIFVRPTIEQQQNYGVFSDTQTLTTAAAYTPVAIPFNTTDFARGFTRGTPNSRIIAAQSGLYNFQFSLQVAGTSSSNKKLWIWPRINGVDVPNSNGEVTLSGGGTVLVPSWNWVLSLEAGDYFELVYAADGTDVVIAYVPAQTGAVGTASFARPAAPSAILTVTQVQQ